MIAQRVRKLLDAASEFWIGWTFPPVHDAIERARWKPDALSAFCRRCGDSVGPGEATQAGCASCGEEGDLAGGIAAGIVRLGPYAEELREWIVSFKYQRWAEMGQFLGRALGRQVRDAGALEFGRMVVVPMPMPWQRRIYRGIDHAQVIASAVAQELQCSSASVLAKSHRPPQVTLVASERRRSGARGMHVRRRIGGWKLAGWDVLLVDDVRTTGASLKAAAKLLTRLGAARVLCAVLAVTDSKARRQRSRQTDAARQVLVHQAEVASTVEVG